MRAYTRCRGHRSSLLRPHWSASAISTAVKKAHRNELQRYEVQLVNISAEGPHGVRLRRDGSKRIAGVLKRIITESDAGAALPACVMRATARTRQLMYITPDFKAGIAEFLKR